MSAHGGVNRGRSCIRDINLTQQHRRGLDRREGVRLSEPMSRRIPQVQSPVAVGRRDPFNSDHNSLKPGWI